MYRCLLPPSFRVWILPDEAGLDVSEFVLSRDLRVRTESGRFNCLAIFRLLSEPRTFSWSCNGLPVHVSTKTKKKNFRRAEVRSQEPGVRG